MATLTSSPSGFSYAQAARGQKSTAASHTSSSKVSSGTATPATGAFSELSPGGNWADDVEATGDTATTDSQGTPQEQRKLSLAKDVAVERTKSESRTPNSSSGVSGVSSPDLAASSSTATTADDTSSVPNGTSSDSTWETKSQTSEPAWIADRKERQSSAHIEDGNQTGKGRRGKKEPKDAKDGKELKESSQSETPPTPVKLQDAPPPAVNPWAKRMETAKAKPATPPKPIAATAASNENQPPRGEAKKKSNSVDMRAVTGDEPKKGNANGSRRAEDGRQIDRGLYKQSSENIAVPNRVPAQREHQSLPNLTAIPPPVKDEGSWPTPESAQEKERKESSAEKDSKDGKDADDSADAEASTAKRHQKQTWKPMAVTPTIIWQTEEMNRPRGGERGGRGGSGRGRGGARGGAHGGKNGDRANGRPNGSSAEMDVNGSGVSRGRSSTIDRESMPPPPKPSHKSSASTSRDGRKTRDPSSHDHSSQVRSSTDIVNSADVAPEGVVNTVPNARHSKSASKSRESDETHDVKIPEPIPRQTPSAVLAGESRESSEPAREDSVRRGPYEGKKESRSFDSYNTKEWSGAPRGGKRNGRGRGGSREFVNGHQSNQAFTNGHHDFATYGVPPSPSGYQTSRGGYTFSQQGRGSWTRNGPRSQSIPIDSVYGAGSRPSWGHHPPHIQTGYYPGAVYDYAGMPMTAMPYNAMVDHTYLMEMVGTQLEYYFSLDNLLKDMFLRKHMDSQGFVFLDVIANFNRVKQLTTDKELIKACCLNSKSIEIRVGEDGKERLRRHQEWEKFLLPKEQREISAQTDGPTMLQQPEPPQVQFFMPNMAFRGPPSAGIPGAPRRSYDSGFPANGQMPPFAPFQQLAEVPSYDELANGEEMRGRAAKSPMRDANGTPNAQSLLGLTAAGNNEPDEFPDDHVSALSVVVKTHTQRSSSHQHVASRTFSNGSIDTRNILSEVEQPTETHSQSTTAGKTLVNGEGRDETATRTTSPSHSRSPDKGAQHPELSLFWVKDTEDPQSNIPEGSTLESYYHLRSKALGQRDQAATGTCPYDLDVLYQFWSHFLIRNFNNKMYTEFEYYANDDAKQRHSPVGLQNLVLFYSKALASSKLIRDNVVRDYVKLVENEPVVLEKAAFKQLRKAWRNGALNLKNRKKLADVLKDEIKAELES